MGGPSQTQQQSEQIQMDVARQNAALGQEYAQMLQGRLAQGDTLQQPLISRLQKLSSNDPSTVLQAAGPELGNIATAGAQAKANVFETVAPGAGRDFALSQIPMQQYSQTAGYLNKIVNDAPQELAQVGAAQYGVGLNLGGLGQSASGTANTAAGQVGNLEQQGKASTLGFLGSLAGGAGSAFGGTKLF